MTNKIKSLSTFIIIVVLSLNAQPLFEIKDAADQTVLEVSEDGLRIFNQGDTLMVISSTEIKAFIDDSAKDRALSRSFSVTTSASKKSETIDVLEITTNATKMREGGAGNKYTDFSPENIFLGLNAGLNTVSELDIYVPIYDGSYNVFVGNNAGVSNTSGWSNIFLGNDAGYSNDDAFRNIYIGVESGYNSNGAYNTFVGFRSGKENTTGGTNTFFGDAAGVTNSTGSYNCYYGHCAGLDNETGGYNTVMGTLAGRSILNSSYNYSNNCFFGYRAGGFKWSGDNNVMIGFESGVSNNTGIGNIFIGHKSGYNETGSNKLYIDNTDTATPLIYGDFSANELTFNGTIFVPSLYTTGGGSQLKYVFIDQYGQLCVSNPKEGNYSQVEDIELLKEENEKLNKRLDELEEIIKKMNK